MRLSELKTNSAAVEAGTWIGDLPGMGELQLKVRGLWNSDWQRLNDKLTAKVPLAKKPGGVIEPAERDRIMTELMIETALLDWRGIEDETGAPLPYSKEAARQYLFDPDYRRLRDAVLTAAAQVGEQTAAGTGADVKN